ncbi:hypothetical protein N656DRAFT_64056 [Canariomyces notabilis]|uniref:Uncharacterized protein n=1 Tax=Canariomyces notabilis TaxID=2074819 RepID=A0AAN6TNM1_9PEZI|nr:hypothetical protein N656DRAFT_64056 [Canariomyces arenarius]
MATRSWRLPQASDLISSLRVSKCLAEINRLGTVLGRLRMGVPRRKCWGPYECCSAVYYCRGTSYMKCLVRYIIMQHFITASAHATLSWRCSEKAAIKKPVHQTSSRRYEMVEDLIRTHLLCAIPPPLCGDELARCGGDINPGRWARSSPRAPLVVCGVDESRRFLPKLGLAYSPAPCSVKVRTFRHCNRLRCTCRTPEASRGQESLGQILESGRRYSSR